VTTLVPGRTVGHCHVNTRTTGSFTIVSTSSTDTPSVLWEVLVDPYV
jgi:hypothetical protein